MTAPVIPFKRKYAAAVFIVPAEEGGWLVLVGDDGWLHGSVLDAWADAQWMADNLNLPIRMLG
jgi:hypothetical protein